MTKLQQRKDNLLPGGVPKWIRCFDNGGVDKPGGTFDRYTVIFTNAQHFGMKGYAVGIIMSENPLHPLGLGQHFEYNNHIYNGRSGGKRIKFQDLPENCRKLVISDYKDYWELND